MLGSVSGAARRRAAPLACGVAGLMLAFPVLPAARAGTGITIDNRTYDPDPAKVTMGDTITWTNASDEDHNVRGGPFSSPTLHPGNTFSFTFTKKGTINYTCDFHPTMKGSIKVT